MDAEKLSAILKRFGACADAIAWADGKPPQEAWEKCERGEWLLWIAWHMIGNTRDTDAGKRLWLARADCAEMALPMYEKRHPRDSRVRDCIQGIRDFANGKIDVVRLSELRAADAYAAAAYAAAAYAAAAYAAAAYAAAAYAADAYAADAYAADAAADAYAAAARTNALAKCADLVRKRLPWKVICEVWKDQVKS